MSAPFPLLFVCSMDPPSHVFIIERLAEVQHETRTHKHMVVMNTVSVAGDGGGRMRSTRKLSRM